MKISVKEQDSPFQEEESYNYQQLDLSNSDEEYEVPDIPTMFQETLHKLDTVEKLKFLFTFMNYFTKIWAVYLVFSDKENVFSHNSLLTFSYILYAFLEAVAMIAAFSIIILAKIIKLLFGVQTYYIESVGCIPILYSIFRFCFIVTFFVQSISLLLFSNFKDWKYPLLLVITLLTLFKCFSLLCILTLQFLRIILLFSRNFTRTYDWVDLECLMKYIAPEKYNKAYRFMKTLFAEVFEFYSNMDPHLKKRMKQAQKFKNKAGEFVKELDWVKKQIHRYSGSQSGKISSQSNPPRTTQIELKEIKEANQDVEQSGTIFYSPKH